MIESKYTIEYINPEDTAKTSSRSRRKQLGYALSGLALAASAYILITLPAKKTPYQPEVVVKQQQQKEKTISANKELLPSKTLVSSKDKTSPENTRQASLSPDPKSFASSNIKDKKTQTTTQTYNLEKLKAQLLETQNRNKELATELDAQIMENMELSALLEDSLYKINKEDKSYIKELKKLEKNTVKVTTSKKVNQKIITSAPPITPALANNLGSSENKKNDIKNITKQTFKITKTKDIASQKANRIDLSTTSQVNAIIANIKGASNPSRQTKIINQQRGRGAVEASRVKLQTDINDIINNSKDEGPLDELKKSLQDI